MFTTSSSLTAFTSGRTCALFTVIIVIITMLVILSHSGVYQMPSHLVLSPQTQNSIPDPIKSSSQIEKTPLLNKEKTSNEKLSPLNEGKTSFLNNEKSSFLNNEKSSFLNNEKSSLLNNLMTVYLKEQNTLGIKQSFSTWLSQLMSTTISTAFQGLISPEKSKAKVEGSSRGLLVSPSKQMLPRNASVLASNSQGDQRNKDPLVILFTSWTENPEKKLVTENVLRTWKLWQPIITPVLFTSEVKVRNHAAQFGWKILPSPRTSCGSMPIYREMFKDAMKAFPNSALFGFANGDMLLGNGLLRTMEAVHQWAVGHNKPLMLIARRINVDFYNKPAIRNVDNLDAIAKEGRPMTDGSTDAIFTNRLFPWDHVPDIVPGRLGVAMWMVSYGREMGADVVDISQTTQVVHMTVTHAGNSEAWTHDNPRCNHIIYNRLGIKPQTWFCGFVRCATFKTEMTSEAGVDRVKVVKNRLHSRCGECHMNMKPLLNTIF